eukprot:5330051-Prymnesium_polylepis.2
MQKVVSPHAPYGFKVFRINRPARRQRNGCSPRHRNAPHPGHRAQSARDASDALAGMQRGSGRPMTHDPSTHVSYMPWTHPAARGPW